MSAAPARGGEGAGQVLPSPEFEWDRPRAALVVIDPQNDFLSPQGAGWPVFGQNVIENNTVANLASLFEAARSSEMTVAISPHYEYPADGNGDPEAQPTSSSTHFTCSNAQGR